MKVLYWVSNEAHKRSCVPIERYDDIDQAVVLPTSVSTSGLSLKIFKYSHPNLNEVIGVIKKFKPDVFVQYTSSRHFVNITKKIGIKHCFSAHGIWPDKSYNNRIIVVDKFFQNFDLFIGGNIGFEKTLREYGKVSSTICLNALTQFDVLYNNMLKQDQIRKGLGNNKVITIFGHKLSTKTDNLAPYDYGYYAAILELDRLAKKYGWIVYVKPKGANTREYIKSCKEKWTTINGIKSKYLSSSFKNVKFLSHNDDPYKYLFSDVIITSARSTIEVEAALIKKPLIRMWMLQQQPCKIQLSYEYGAMDFKAEYLVKDIHKLEKNIIKALHNSNELNDNQDKLLAHHGIIFDGKANKRLLNAIREVGEK